MIKKILNSKNEIGFGLMETMVAIFIISIVGLGLTKTILSSMHNAKKFQVREAAESLVRSQLEIYSMKNPNALLHDTDYDLTETDLTYPSLSETYTFDRTTDITLGTSNTIDVEVTATCNHPLFPVTYSGTASFAQW